MASGATYEYTAIVAPKTIRLMRLHPGAPSDPVSLSLEIIALDSTPDFEAISYCWGQAPEMQLVTCNDAALSISNSLFTGLVHFRYADRPRMLWADAICINQADATEKGSQVLLMPYIYSQATSTLVWLGVENDPEFGSVHPNVTATISKALEWLPDIDADNPAKLAAMIQAIHAESVRLHNEGKPNLLDHDWAPLEALLKRPWFRRKWVVQEVALSKKVVLYAGGGVQVPWPDLARFAFNVHLVEFEKLQQLQVGEKSAMFANAALDCIAGILMVQMFRDRGTLVDGVVDTMTFHCTDPRDLVYSLLSLVTAGPTIYPDYNASLSEMFVRFAIAMMVQGRSLKLLSLAPHMFAWGTPGVERLEGLPTWVPDLRHMKANTLASYTVRPQAFFAGGHDKPVLSISDDERVLRCQGRVVDTVKTTSTSLVEMILADVPELRFATDFLKDPSEERSNARLSELLNTCYKTAFGHSIDSETAAAPSKESMRAFSRTMVCDVDGMRNRLPVEITDAFPQYMRWVTKRAKGEQNEDENHAGFMTGYSASADMVLRALSVIRRFSITEHGRFGQLPLESQPGDRICVLVGAEVPFVVRPTGRETYTLIGECYVDGIMDGEALAEQGVAVTKSLETISLE